MLTVINHNIYVFVLVIFVITASAIVILLHLRGPIARLLFQLRMTHQTGISSWAMMASVVLFFTFFASTEYMGSPSVCYIGVEDGDIVCRQYNVTTSKFTAPDGTTYKVVPLKVLYINHTPQTLYVGHKTIDRFPTPALTDVETIAPHTSVAYSDFPDYQFRQSPNKLYLTDEDPDDKTETFVILDTKKDLWRHHHISF